jgi:hypothetical protein
MKATWTILLVTGIVVGCQPVEEEKKPNLLADREAPLGWVTLKTYPENTFEFIV